MKATTKTFMDLLAMRSEKKWSKKMIDMIHTHNAVNSFVSETFKDIQSKNKKIKSRGMSFEFEINDIETPPGIKGKRFVMRTWCGMGRIVVHVGEVHKQDLPIPEDEKSRLVEHEGDKKNLSETIKTVLNEPFISMVGPDEGDQSPGMQGIDWDTDTAVFVLWYIEDRWWSFKNKLVETDTLQFV